MEEVALSPQTVSIPLSNEFAMRYERATDEERLKIQALLELLIRELTRDSAKPLSTLMDDISDKAQARGLTPKHMSELLKES